MPDPAQEANYTLLDSDYDSYAIVYSCVSLFYGFASFEYLWILYREPEIADDKLAELVAKINDKLPDYDFYDATVKTVQGKENCPYDEWVAES